MLVNRVKDYRKGRGLTQEDLASQRQVLAGRLLFQSKKTNSFQGLMLH